MLRNLLSLALLLAVLSFATGASAQSRSFGPMMGYGWSASGTAAGTGTTSTGAQFAPPMWNLLSTQTGQTGTASTGSTTASDFWAQMPMFQFLSQ